jgi:integrase
MATSKRRTWPLEIKSGGVRVKIYKTVDRNYERFTVAYHEGARRRLKQFADEAKARREAKLVAERLNAGQGEILSLSGKDRDSFQHAKYKLKALGIPLADAIDEYVAAKALKVPLLAAAKFYHETHSTKLPDKSVTEVVQEMLEAKRKDRVSKVYLHDLKTRLGRFSRDFSVRIADVQTQDIDGWLRRLKGSPRSRNNDRNVIVSLFNFAKSSGYLNRDRTTAAAHTALARKNVEAIEIFTPQEFAKLLTAASDAVLPLFVLGGFCGLRTSEVLRLNWEDLRWPESSIVISAAVSKTRTRRLAPMTEPATAWLSRWRGRTGRVLPFDRSEQRVWSISRRAGVMWRKNGLRHSFITYRLGMLRDPVRVAFECGNSPQVIRSNYDAVATEQYGKLWFSIKPKTAAKVAQMRMGM